ncbi:hypothetical protein CEB3_c17520 [Peptococcaceae bacterium CEB3]|nr:hypothetical protein CEB3_c17520 [Peptococcaceae bacterium CEB3]
MLKIVPIHFKNANKFITENHRHHEGVKHGYKFCVAVANDADVIVGVAIAGLPVNQYMNDGLTLEVRRTCTVSTKNANSMLYGACFRAAKALGYKKLITYTLQEESGISLRAAGWKAVAKVRPCPWTTEKRQRNVPAGIEQKPKYRWEIVVKSA